MSSKDIFVIVLLLVILAIVYKLMQTMKLQSELTQGIAIKAGVVIPKREKKGLLDQVMGKEECTDCGDEDLDEEETEEQENVDTEEETQDEEEQREEEELNETKQEEIEESQHIVRDLEPRNHLIKVTKPKLEFDNPRKYNKKDKSKGYEKIAKLLDVPLTAGDLKDKWNQEFGKTPDAKIIYSLNYGLTLGMIKKHPIGKRFLYARPDMFEGDQLKPEYLPTI